MILDAEPTPREALVLAVQIHADVVRGQIDFGSVPHPGTHVNNMPGLPQSPQIPSPETIARRLSHDPVINQLWFELHHRVLIEDPERTGDIRGLDVSDESRYLGTRSPRGEQVGHGFDNVQEFVASFVACTLQLQESMTRTVSSARDPQLSSLYHRVWDWTNAHLIPLGDTNPY